MWLIISPWILREVSALAGDDCLHCADTRRAVIHYAVFAHAARRATQDFVDTNGYDKEVGAIFFGATRVLVTRSS